MDLLSEELLQLGDGFKLDEEFIIAVLLWVDDVVSCVDGEEDQLIMLKRIHEFAIKHRLIWGQSKCKVMRIGKHNDAPKQWPLGDMMIEETDSYKYLGDFISNDGKNSKNIDSRRQKINTTTVAINSIASSEILRGIETSVLLNLHGKKNISQLLANAESWSLNRSEKMELERIEIQALKYLFDLPAHTPTPAIIYSLGTLYTNQRVDKKRFMYLHRILNMNQDQYPSKTFHTLEKLNIGWYKNIKETLTDYGLPTDFTAIKSTSRRQWKKRVCDKIEAKNRSRLIDDCHKLENGVKTPKTKTAHIIPHLTSNDYKREPLKEIIELSKYDTKTIITARFGMLQCGKNFKGTMNEMCNECQKIDDEDHRLNHCPKYHYNHETNIDFKNIFSNDVNILRDILPSIKKVWNTKTANGSMNE